MLEPRVSWGLVGAASRGRNLDRMAHTTARGARVFVTGIVSHAEANKHLRAHDRVIVSTVLPQRRVRLTICRQTCQAGEAGQLSGAPQAVQAVIGGQTGTWQR